MIQNKQKSEDRGQVGIGTLIVFIAMVLVAAIAAGVLINTAGLLQTQAEATGEETQEQVSDRLQVQSATGEVGEDGDGNDVVDEVSITVTKAPGAQDIDLKEVTYEIVTDGGVETEAIEDEDDPDTNDDLDVITAENDNDAVITNRGDRYQIVLDDGQFPNGDALDPGDTALVTLTTAAGASTVSELRVPDSLVDRDAVSL